MMTQTYEFRLLIVGNSRLVNIFVSLGDWTWLFALVILTISSYFLLIQVFSWMQEKGGGKDDL